jgi:PhnB protein
MPECCPHLHFDGTAADAMRTYQRVLGGELSMMTYGQMPPGQGEAPPGCGPVDPDRVLHAALRFEGGMLMASDVPPSKKAPSHQGFSVNLIFADVEDARHVYDALAEHAQEVGMAFGPTFWANGFGMVTDRFGTPWVVNGGLRPA